MHKKLMILSLSFLFLLLGSVELDAQSRKKKKKKRGTKERTTQVDESEESDTASERSSRSSRSSNEDEESGITNFFNNDKLVFDLMGNLGIQQVGLSSGDVGTIIKIGLKPAISYKLLERIHLGIAPKLNYFFLNVPQAPDENWFDVGAEVFTRAVIFESIYLQLGYDFNSLEAWYAERQWTNGAMIGGGYMQGYGDWKYGAQVMFELNEELRDYDNFPIEIWVGFTYNL